MPTNGPWYSIYNTTTGVQWGLGTVLPSPMPAGHGSKKYDQKPGSNLYWDTTARDYVIPAGV